MSESNTRLKPRLWLGVVGNLLSFVLMVTIVFLAVIPTLLWVGRENLLPVREHFYVLAIAMFAGALVVASFVARMIVWGRSYTTEQQEADQLRHAELFGPKWFYEYLRDMTAEDRARYDAIGRWTARLFVLSALLVIPAGILLDRGVLWIIVPAVLGLGQLCMYLHARSVARRHSR